MSFCGLPSISREAGSQVPAENRNAYQKKALENERKAKDEKIKAVFQEKSGFQWLFLAILTMGLGYGIYKGVIDNYLANIVVMGEFERDLAEFFRELPGLLLVLLLALFYTLSAESLYKIGALIMLAGMGMLALVSPTKLLVTLAICVYSLGEHIQLGMKNTMTLQYARWTAPRQVDSEIIKREFTALRRCGNRRFRLAAKASDRNLRFFRPLNTGCASPSA